MTTGEGDCIDQKLLKQVQDITFAVRATVRRSPFRAFSHCGFQPDCQSSVTNSATGRTQAGAALGTSSATWRKGRC